jgi:hypothetical protein
LACTRHTEERAAKCSVSIDEKYPFSKNQRTYYQTRN